MPPESTWSGECSWSPSDASPEAWLDLSGCGQPDPLHIVERRHAGDKPRAARRRRVRWPVWPPGAGLGTEVADAVRHARPEDRDGDALTAPATAVEQAAPLRRQAPAHRQSSGASWRAVARPALAWYVLARLLLLGETLWVAHHDDLAVTRILEPRDGHFYVDIAVSGYPATFDPHVYSQVAFFPLFPLLGRALAIVTRLPVEWTLLVVSLCAGLAAAVLGGLLASELWGVQRGRQAAVLMAVFPGTVVVSMTYSDSLAVALACACLLALERRRHLLAGAAGAAASAAISVATVPLAAAAVVVAFLRRRPKALLVAAAVPLGALGFFSYLWVHTGSPLSWARAEAGAWHTHLSLPWSAGSGFARYGFEHPEVATVTIISLVLATASLVALAARSAPLHWVVYVVLVYASVIFGGAPHLTPRHLYDAFPGLLAMGAALPRRLVPVVAVLCVFGLVFLFGAYDPNNRFFLAP